MRPSVRATIGAILLGVITMSPPFLTGALGLQMRIELDLGQADLGLTVSAFFLVTALSSPLLGGWADRLGAVRGLRISAALVAVVMSVIAFGARSGWVLAALLALAGVANGIGGPTASLLISRHVVGRQALAFGLKQAAVPATTLLAGLAVPVLALTVGWRWAFAAAAAIAALLAVGAPGLSDDRPVVRGRSAAARLHTGSLVLIAVAFGCATAAATGLSSFLVDLSVERGLGEAGAGLLLAGISVATIASRIAVGWHADRPDVDPFTASMGLAALGAIGYALLSVGRGIPSVVVGATLAFGAGWGWTGLMAYAATRGNPDGPAAAAGFVQTGGASGGIVGPTATGLILEHSSHRTAWAVATAFLLLAILALGAVWRGEFGQALRTGGPAAAGRIA